MNIEILKEELKEKLDDKEISQLINDLGENLELTSDIIIIEDPKEFVKNTTMCDYFNYLNLTDSYKASNSEDKRICSVLGNYKIPKAGELTEDRYKDGTFILNYKEAPQFNLKDNIGVISAVSLEDMLVETKLHLYIGNKELDKTYNDYIREEKAEHIINNINDYCENKLSKEKIDEILDNLGVRIHDDFYIHVTDDPINFVRSVELDEYEMGAMESIERDVIIGNCEIPKGKISYDELGVNKDGEESEINFKIKEPVAILRQLEYDEYHGEDSPFIRLSIYVGNDKLEDIDYKDYLAIK